MYDATIIGIIVISRDAAENAMGPNAVSSEFRIVEYVRKEDKCSSPSST